MCEMKLGDNFWSSFTESSELELRQYEDRCYEEASTLFNEIPSKANEILDAVVQQLELRKILHDMYVWQRVDAVKKGINKAKRELQSFCL